MHSEITRRFAIAIVRETSKSTMATNSFFLPVVHGYRVPAAIKRRVLTSASGQSRCNFFERTKDGDLQNTDKEETR